MHGPTCNRETADTLLFPAPGKSNSGTGACTAHTRSQPLQPQVSPLFSFFQTYFAWARVHSMQTSVAKCYVTTISPQGHTECNKRRRDRGRGREKDNRGGIYFTCSPHPPARPTFDLGFLVFFTRNANIFHDFVFLMVFIFQRST